MPPNQAPQQPSYNQPPASEAPQNPYHFILNPEQPKRSSPFGKPTGLLFIVGAVVFVVILFVIILNIARGGGSSSQPYVTVAQEQVEISRVAGLDLGRVQDTDVKNFATTTRLTMASDSTAFTTFLGEHGVKISKKQLAAGVVSTTDAQLTSAISSNTLDPTLRTVLQNELKQYQSDLAKAYRITSNGSTRTMLKQLNNNAELLLTQSTQ
jgi:hypothetical protein